MSFLLDTDTVSYALRGRNGVDEALRSHLPSEVSVSAATVAELRFGAHKRGSEKLHQLLDQFLASMTVHPFDSRIAARYGELAATLAAAGESIGIFDTIIAAHALELDLTLVTHNTRHFQRVAGLSLVDWVKPEP